MNHLNRLITAGCFGTIAVLSVGDVRSQPAAQEVAIDCNVSSNNDGCETTVSCPAGTTIHSAVAACNLEFGLVSAEQLSSIEQGNLQVVAPSDHVEEGNCWIGSNSLRSGAQVIEGIEGQTSVTIGCQEHDKNGGDCDIRGSLYCQ
ncbi:MAG TPA: hypothetical protein VGJ84_24490 [Polyangiaceae bacterium]|jgi:hypothetical protein